MTIRKAFLVICLTIAACNDHPVEPDAGMVDMLPIQEGQVWEFDYVSRASSTGGGYSQTQRAGTVTLQVVEISPFDNDSQAIALEKHLIYSGISTWDSLDTGVIRYDSTVVDRIDTLYWLANDDRIRMDGLFPESISRYAQANRDTVLFENGPPYERRSLTLMRNEGIVRYSHTSFEKIGPSYSEHWVRR
jgi:hypothetical protein